MSVNIEPVTSIDAIERNFNRLVSELVEMQGQTIAVESINGYENLASKNFVDDRLKTLRDEVQYAVGDIHLSESPDDPKDKLGYGEWEQVGQGRFVAGLGEASGALALATSEDATMEPYPVYMWRRKS